MDIQLTDYKGHTWHLAGAQEGDEGVTLHKISGTDGKLSDHPVPTTQHFPTHTYDTATPEPISPTLTVSITHTTSLTTETTIRRFLDGLDFYKPAILTFHQPRQPELQLFVHLESPIGLPEETAPTDTTTLEIHLTAQDGRYFGPEHTSTGITTIENTGQLPLWPTIHWKGLTARVTEDKTAPSSSHQHSAQPASSTTPTPTPEALSPTHTATPTTTPGPHYEESPGHAPSCPATPPPSTATNATSTGATNTYNPGHKQEE